MGVRTQKPYVKDVKNYFTVLFDSLSFQLSMGHCFYNENTDQICVQVESTYGEFISILGKNKGIKQMWLAKIRRRLL